MFAEFCCLRFICAAGGEPIVSVRAVVCTDHCLTPVLPSVPSLKKLMQQQHFERRYLAPLPLPPPSRRHRISVRALTDPHEDDPSSTSNKPLSEPYRGYRGDALLMHPIRDPAASGRSFSSHRVYSISSAGQFGAPYAEGYPSRANQDFSLTPTPPLPPPTPPPPPTYLPPPIPPLHRSQYYAPPQPRYAGYGVSSRWYPSQYAYPTSLSVSHTIAKRKRTVKRLWTPQEDERLRHLARMRPENWNVIAESLPGRTGKQCRERWLNHLRDGT